MALRAVFGNHGNSKSEHLGGQMSQLQDMISELSKRADDNDLIALLATNRQARLYNAHLARELRDVVCALKIELDRVSAPCQPGATEILSGQETIQ